MRRKSVGGYTIVRRHGGGKAATAPREVAAFAGGSLPQTAAVRLPPNSVFHGWGESFPKKDEDERNRLFYTADLVVESEPLVRAFNLARNLFSSACLYVYIHD